MLSRLKKLSNENDLPTIPQIDNSPSGSRPRNDIAFSGQHTSSKNVPRNVSLLHSSKQPRSRDSTPTVIITSQHHNPSEKPPPPRTSSQNKSDILPTRKPHTVSRTPPKTTSVQTLTETPTKGSGPLPGQPESSLARRPLLPNIANGSHPSPNVVGAKKDGRYENQKSRSKPLAEHATVPHAASNPRGNKKHSAASTQAASGQEFPDDGFNTSMSAPGAGYPFKDKGKGKALEPIDTKSFPPAWGFGRAQKQAPGGPPVTQMTLLELLSCRKHELFRPHQSDVEKRLTLASVTTHNQFPYEDVSGKCRNWSDFTFQNMLTQFQFLNRTVSVPGELGPESPSFTFHNEAELHASLDSHLFRYMRQYLRITFDRFGQEVHRSSATPVTIRDGNFMRPVKQKKPDFGVYSEGIRASLTSMSTKKKSGDDLRPVNRMIIEVKPSSKWDPKWWDINLDEVTKIGQARDLDDYNGEQIYYAALAQLHYYMVHSGADYAGPVYGVLLTDKYLLPVKREGSRYGELYLGAAIPWSRSFENAEQVSGFTVQSALWYLSMLASMPGWHYGGPTVRRTVREGGNREVETQKPTKQAEQEK